MTHIVPSRPNARPHILRRVAKAVLLWPPIALLGYWFATACVFAWGIVLLGHFHHSAQHKIFYFDHLPKWAFGRGGTTIGAIYLTHDNVSDPVLTHEAVHRTQWRHYGLPFIVLYVHAGRDALHNRFEIAAGLRDGGYIR